MTVKGMIMQLQDFIAHGMKPTAIVKSWDGDSGEWQPVSGFIYDADSIELQTDIDECDELPPAPTSVPQAELPKKYDEVATAKLQMSRRLVVCEAVNTPHSYAICSCTEGHHGARLADNPIALEISDSNFVPQAEPPCATCGNPKSHPMHITDTPVTSSSHTYTSKAWGEIYSEDIAGSADPVVRLANSIVSHCAIVTPRTKDNAGLFSDQTYVEAVHDAVMKIRILLPIPPFSEARPK